MNIRKLTSLTALLAFALLVLTSVILYIVPQGRVAYWADWQLWGLSKTDWGNIHINLGLLLLVSILLHIYYNWRLIVSYLKNRAKVLRIFTKEFNVAVLLTGIFIFGTHLLVPPFSWVIDLNDFVKNSAAQKYGEPPYGHAELSTLEKFSSRMGLNLAECLERLKQAGIKLEGSTQTIQEVARNNRLSPQQVFLAMKPVVDPPPDNKMPDTPPAGIGKRSLTDICQTYDLKISVILQRLANQGIHATAELSLKEIAEQNNMSPIDVYGVISKN
jgi:AraC-like DNA-binding protein